MANPTNINVAPALAADPTNVGTAVHGTKFPNAVVGTEDTLTLVQGSDLGNGVTAGVVAQVKMPWRGYIRKMSHSNYSVAATCTFDVYNSTTSTTIVSTVTPTTNACAEVTSFATAAAQSFNEGDIVQVRVTTSGGAGACKGLNCVFDIVQLEGTTVNPV